MRKPNYIVFVYDASGRFVDRLSYWALNANTAVDKAKKRIEERHRKIENLSFVARFEG